MATPPTRSTLAVLAVELMMSSCSPTATIHQKGGVVTEAEIIGSDHHTLYVRNDDGKATIQRRKVTEINHPGVTAMIGGMALALGGLSEGIYAGAQWQDTPEDERDPIYTHLAIGGALLITGVTFAILGAGVHSDSKEAAYPTSKRKSD